MSFAFSSLVFCFHPLFIIKERIHILVANGMYFNFSACQRIFFVIFLWVQAINDFKMWLLPWGQFYLHWNSIEFNFSKGFIYFPIVRINQRLDFRTMHILLINFDLLSLQDLKPEGRDEFFLVYRTNGCCAQLIGSESHAVISPVAFTYSACALIYFRVIEPQFTRRTKEMNSRASRIHLLLLWYSTVFFTYAVSFSVETMVPCRRCSPILG